MRSNAARKLNLLRTVGKRQNHDYGLTQPDPERTEDEIDIEKLNKGFDFFRDNFFSIFVNMLSGK